MKRNCKPCKFVRTCSLRKHNKAILCKRYRKIYDIKTNPEESKKLRIQNENTIIEKQIRQQQKQEMKNFTEDILDSKGDDITDAEFIENEAFFECMD